MLRELRSHGMSTVVQLGYLFPEPSHNTTVLICCVVKNLPQHNTLKYTRTVDWSLAQSRSYVVYFTVSVAVQNT